MESLTFTVVICTKDRSERSLFSAGVSAQEPVSERLRRSTEEDSFEQACGVEPYDLFSVDGHVDEAAFPDSRVLRGVGRVISRVNLEA